MKEKQKEECLIVCNGWYSNPLLELDKIYQRKLDNGNIVVIAKSYLSAYGNYICLKTPNGNIINLKKIDNINNVDYDVKSFDVNDDVVSVVYDDKYHGISTITYYLAEIPEETIQKFIMERVIYDFGKRIRWWKSLVDVWTGDILIRDKNSMPFGYEIDYVKKNISIYFNITTHGHHSQIGSGKYGQIISFENNQLRLVNSGPCQLLNGCSNSLDEINQIIETINKSSYWKDMPIGR